MQRVRRNVILGAALAVAVSGGAVLTAQSTVAPTNDAPNPY